MDQDAPNLTQVIDALESIRQEMTRLADRVATLESATAEEPAEAIQSIEASPSHSDVSEEVLLAISAAVAQYLGVKPHIRQISLVGGPSWAQQGRVTVQASHMLPTHQR
jgi:methylmalonyl-CoA carboxyltransferase large subunit